MRRPSQQRQASPKQRPPSHLHMPSRRPNRPWPQKPPRSSLRQVSPDSREISVSIRTSPGGRSTNWLEPVRAPRAQPRRRAQAGPGRHRPVAAGYRLQAESGCWLHPRPSARRRSLRNVPASSYGSASTNCEARCIPPNKGSDPHGLPQAHQVPRHRRWGHRDRGRCLRHRRRNRQHRLRHRDDGVIRIGCIRATRHRQRGIQCSLRTGRRGLIRHGRQRFQVEFHNLDMQRVRR